MMCVYVHICCHPSWSTGELRLNVFPSLSGRAHVLLVKKGGGGEERKEELGVIMWEWGMIMGMWLNVNEECAASFPSLLPSVSVCICVCVCVSVSVQWRRV